MLTKLKEFHGYAVDLFASKFFYFDDPTTAQRYADFLHTAGYPEARQIGSSVELPS